MKGTWCEDEEPIGSDTLQNIDLVILVSTAEFHLMAAANPSERTREVVGVLIGVARAGDGIADRCVTAGLDKRRTDSGLERRLVFEAETLGSSVVDVLVDKEFVAQVGEARDAHDGGGKSVGLLGNEILGALIFDRRETPERWHQPRKAGRAASPD